MRQARRVCSMILTASLALFPLVGCGSADAGGEAEPEEQVQIANPFVDCDSAYDAAQLAGFEVTFPESVPGYSERSYQVIEGQLIQCLYTEGAQSVLIRKGVDDGSGDISGDYNDYDQTVQVAVGSLTVTERGDGALVHVATWAKDGYAFSIGSDAGLEPAVIEELVAATL